MHEPNTVGLFYRDADMRSVGARVFASDRDDVTGAEVTLDGGHAAFGNMINRQGGNFLLDARHLGKLGWVIAEVAVTFPHGGHLADLAGKPLAAEFLCGVFG